jgi:hypothetical protein
MTEEKDQQQKQLTIDEFIKYWIVSMVGGSAISKDREEFESALDFTEKEVKADLKKNNIKLLTQKDYNLIKKFGLFIYDKIEEGKNVSI